MSGLVENITQNNTYNKYMYKHQAFGCRTTKLRPQKRRHLSSGILHQLHLTKGNQSRKKDIIVGRKNHLFSSILHRSNRNRLLWPQLVQIYVHNYLQSTYLLMYFHESCARTKLNVSIDILFKL